MSLRRCILLPKYCRVSVGDERSGGKKANRPEKKRQESKIGKQPSSKASIPPSSTSSKPSRSRRRQASLEPTGKKVVVPAQPVPVEDLAALKWYITRSHEFRAAKKYPLVESNLKHALDLTEKLFPSGHQRVAEALENYAASLRLLDRLDEAVLFKGRAEVIRGRNSTPEPSPDSCVNSQSPVPVSSCTEPLPRPIEVGSPSPVGLADLLHLKSSILRLEEFIFWESLDERWTSGRDRWVEEVCSAPTVNALCQLVADFEAHLLWDVSEEGWRATRDGWSAGCFEATEMTSLVEALVVLEDHIRIDAFQDGWVDERAYWGRLVQWSHAD